MLHKFYNLVAESNDGTSEYALDREYILDVPEYDQSSILDKQENIGIMLDMIVAASGENICSFSTEAV